ncbi:MAG: cell surface protein SprA [Bacteroidales bacterium]|nr:cell surface protein SprA [Bacteroidales bacterium]
MSFGNNARKYLITILAAFAVCSLIWAMPTPRTSMPSRFVEEEIGQTDIDPSYLTTEDNPEVVAHTFAADSVLAVRHELPIDPPDTGLRVPIPNYDNNPLDDDQFYSPFHLNTPPSLHTDIHYDSATNTYQFQNMIGNTPYGPASDMSIEEYIDYDMKQAMKNYWRDKGASYTSHGNRRGGGIIPQIHVGGDIFESIFGSNTIDIRPSGNVELIFGVLHNRNDNPSLPVKQRKVTQFNFDEHIQLNALAKIGDKIEFNLNYNTEAMFDFENKMKLKFEGKEDDILQLIEFGDVTMPLNSTLITGSQSLFGGKLQLKFGKLMITAVASQKRAESQTITVSGGAQTNEFYFKADEYEENRHYFLGQFFRDHYNQYLSTLPLVSSPIVISKIEVWRTTIGSATQENRNIVAFTDLGETDPQFAGFAPTPGVYYPCDTANNLPIIIDTSLYRDLSSVTNNLRARGLTSGVDYEKVESARLLSPSEYTFNAQLGFISLNSALTADQVLAVAFQYTIIGDDHIYQVGEFSNEVSAPQCLRVKLLKSTTLDTKSPLWNLMMKNVYSLGAYQVSAEDFILNILYTGDDEGVPNGFFNLGPEKGIPLIRLMGLDSLNKQQDPYPDGIFDFLDGAATKGGTINSTNGKIYFPTVEPFGKDLRARLSDPAIADRYAFDTLYRTTKTIAQQYTSKNKYYLEGSYKSSYGSEIYLNAMNIPEGSVKVTAGGITLQENIDYTVNYSMGTVSITNQGVLNSGTPISISLENQTGVSMKDQRMFGLNLDYTFSENFNIGATMLNLSERPLTQKVNYGEEPINNVIWGMNLNYKTKLPWVTKAVNLLSFHSTTTESNLQLEGEFAHFIPGHSRAIGKEGTTYIDDFEATKSTTDLRSFYKWTLASTPQAQIQMFPEANVSENDPIRKQLAYGYNRAKFCWYIIDPLFYRNNNATPSNITAEDQSAPYAREVYETELFPYKENASTQPTNLSVLNLAFYPSERGPYNYDVNGAEGYSAGVDADGNLNDPASRWGGIMREMDNTDFESANYEYIEFWMMDPFIENPNHSGGKLYFNLGDISEDILKDGKKFFENGLPVDGSDENVEFTAWGRVPTTQMIVMAFDNNNDARQHQDVGFDGLPDIREQSYFDESYLTLMNNQFGEGSGAYTKAIADPSSDNYHYFCGSDYDEMDVKILDRYKAYNNPQGNSPTDSQSPENYPTTGTNIPNIEDVNNDNTLSEDEKYYQYVIDLRPDRMNVGENYINDVYDAVPEPLPNGSRPTTRWYQFKIPIKHPDKVVGNISGFNSIRFMRLFMREFSEPIICRLATFELVRSDWRTYALDLLEDGDYLPAQGGDATSFDVSSLSYEENGNRYPIPYVLPPGIEREQGFGSITNYHENEQTLTMKVQNLVDGDARAIYKTTAYDLRKFKRLKMFVHAEKVNQDDNIKAGDVKVFIRLGSDFTENYYEYEMPLELTPWFCGKDSTAIWPMNNRMEIVLDSLVAVKQRRNIEARAGHVAYGEPYPARGLTPSNEPVITVVGNPNLADVATIMIGIRNPKKRTMNDGDDMLSKSVEVWVNELRLCDFDNKQGFAALGRMRVNLADVGDITLSGTFSTPGFGSLDQSVTETQQETRYTIDFATNLEAGKTLFPEKWNIRIPLHYDLSQSVAIPEYNPLNPDVKLKEDLKTYETFHERDSIRHMVTDYVRRQNVNLMNVRKERNFNGPIKIRPWDIENFDFSYAYSETKVRNVDVEFDNEFSHQGELGYSFNYNPKNIRPLANQKWLKSKWLQIIRDFNFYPLPKMFTFRGAVFREFNEFKYRPKSKGNIIIDTSYVKRFDVTRNYALRWDISQGLKFEYTANAAARLDEPQGLIDTRAERDSIWRCFGKGGRINTFQQRFDASWQVPINKIPLFSWITASARYSSTYDFTSSSLSLSYLGNTIANSQTLQLNGNVNFVNLYNKVPYLKKVNQGNNNRGKLQGKATATKMKGAADEDDDSKSKGKGKGKDKNAKDSLKEKPNYGKIIGDGILRFLMLLRNASLSYSQGNGITMPGYMYSPNMLGLSFKNASPGFLFVFGGQTDIRHIASERDWLTKDTLMNYPYQENHNRTINFRATVEPFKDFRIDVTATRNETSSYTEFYRADREGVFHTYSPKTTGNYSITQFALGSFFRDGNELFEEFKDMRLLLSSRLSEQNPNSGGRIDDTTGYYVGYGRLSQDVLTAAFLSTYAGKNPNKVIVGSPFPKVPLPNWRLNYTGFTKIKGVSKYFQSLSLIHAYTCTYSVGNYASNLYYTEDANHYPNSFDPLGNFRTKYEIAQITISEALNPLIGFDMTLKNSVMIKVEFKRSRNTALSFANNQITETTSNELAVSAGYRIKDITIGFIFSGMKRQITSDLNLSVSFAMKDNRTVLRKIAEEVNQISAGSLSMTINFSADYQLSKMVGLTLYYDHIINRPYISQQYNNMNIEAGLKVRLMLTQ